MVNQRKQTTNPNTGITPKKTASQTPINWPPLILPPTPIKFGAPGMNDEEKDVINNWHESLKNTIQTQFDAMNSTIQAQATQIATLQNK